MIFVPETKQLLARFKDLSTNLLIKPNKVISVRINNKINNSVHTILYKPTCVFTDSLKINNFWRNDEIGFNFHVTIPTCLLMRGINKLETAVTLDNNYSLKEIINVTVK